MDPRDLLIANLDVVERVIAYTCRRYKMAPADKEEFASIVKLKLVDNDYSILRQFANRSSFTTFISVVVQRMLLDYRIHEWGKWHPSSEARRLGETATELERMIVRDGHTVEQAFPILRARDDTVTVEGLRHIAAQLPIRPPRRRTVELDEAREVQTDDAIEFRQARQTASQQVSGVICTFIDDLPPDLRLILQLRFDSAMTVAQIARALHIDQKQLYRQIERLLRDLRKKLDEAGVDAEEAASLIEDRGVVLDFHLGKSPLRPSLKDKEKLAPGKEEASR